MSQVEIRVRPVIRYAVTRYSGDGRSASLQTLGEFDNEGYANEVAEAMRPREWKYVIVERSFTPECRVFYAYELAEACGMATALSDKYGSEFNVYMQEVKNPGTIVPVSDEERARWENHIRDQGEIRKAREIMDGVGKQTTSD